MYDRPNPFEKRKVRRDIPKPPPWAKNSIQAYLLKLRDGDSFVIHSDKERRQVLNAIYRITQRHKLSWVNVRMRLLTQEDGQPAKDTWRVWMDVQTPDERTAERIRARPMPTIERI